MRLTSAIASTAAITVPAPAFDYSVDWHYDRNQPLNVLAIYLSAIDCMYGLAQRGWDDRLIGGWQIWASGQKVEVDVESTGGSHGPLPLLTSHIVVAVYSTVEKLWKDKAFCKVTTSISIGQRQIGTLKIQPFAGRATSVGVTNSDIGNSTAENLSTNPATQPSGQVTDKDDVRFTVDYAYSGARIDSQEMFIAILDALANSAPHPDTSDFHHLAAASASGGCTIVIYKVASPYQITYSYTTRALRTLTRFVIQPLRRFGEMTFELNWKGTNIAKGYFKKVEVLLVEGDGRVSNTSEGYSALE